MSIISEVKCARCDRQYSGVRSRCPYCGARRIGKGKYSEGNDNSRGKMTIGVLILAVLVVAAGVLLFTASGDEDMPQTSPTGNISSTETPEQLPTETDNVIVTGSAPEVPESPSQPPETETPSVPPPRVQSITITYAGYPITDKDFSGFVGEEVWLELRVEPVGVEYEEEIVWKSSDTTVFEVVPTNIQGTAAKVTIICSGSNTSAVLTVSLGEFTDESWVRLRR